MRILLFIILAILVFLYIPLNRQAPVYRFKTRIDDQIPLLPWTVWIYFSYYLLLPFSIIVTWNSLYSVPFLITQIFATATASLVWWLFPNGVARPQIKHIFTRSHRLLSSLYYYDRDCNGLPSGHILQSFISCYFLAKMYPQLWLMFFAIGLLISLSTLTTKQHYFIDAAGSLMLVPLVFRLSDLII